MKIQYLGHSCFRLISDMGMTIVCDPYDEKTLTHPAPQLSCDAVTVSHRHHDHDCADAMLGRPVLLEREVALAADDVTITSIKSFHDDKKGKLRGENYVFCFSFSGIKVVHMGDIGEKDLALAAQIRGCDVLLLPVGGVYTVDAEGAYWYVQQVRPKIVVPMHYHTDQHTFDLDGLDKFLALCQSFPIKRVCETLTLEDVPNGDTQIVVMQPYED